MPYKRHPSRIELSNPDAAAEVRRWFFELNPPPTIEQAVERVKAEFNFTISPTGMYRFWKRCEEARQREQEHREFLIEAREMAKESLAIAGTEGPALYLRSVAIQVGAVCTHLLNRTRPFDEPAGEQDPKCGKKGGKKGSKQGGAKRISKAERDRQRQEHKDSITTLNRLVASLVNAAREARSGDTLDFNREKYQESLRTKTDVALDAFAAFLSEQPALLEKFNVLRAEVKAVMS